MGVMAKVQTFTRCGLYNKFGFDQRLHLYQKQFYFQKCFLVDLQPKLSISTLPNTGSILVIIIYAIFVSYLLIYN